MVSSLQAGKANPQARKPTVEFAAGLDSRILACQVLQGVLRNQQPLDESFAVLSAKPQFASIPARDRAFARAIATVALRRLGQIEDFLHHFMDRQLPKEATARFILISGVTQLVFLEVAPHAVINLAVEQAKSSRGDVRFANLINAVLRRVAGEGSKILAQQDGPRLNTPTWLYERWVRTYGADTATKIANAHLEEPALDLTMKSDAESWTERLSGTPLPWNSVRLSHKGRIEEIPGYDEGAWWVQDAAASLPALLLGEVKGLKVADLCAAPGGKTAQLAAKGASVTAVDISKRRLVRFENLVRLRLEADIVEADAGKWLYPAQFDAVILDAPCSATGTIRRHPDISYLKSEGDIAALSKVQERLLDHAINSVRPGGRIVYCTCSLEPEEGEDQLTCLLQSRDDVEVDPIKASETHFLPEFVSPKGTLRTLPFYLQRGPGLNGMDGFFAARLLKK